MRMWIRRWLPMLTVLTALPLLLATASCGQPCTADALQQSVEQLQDQQQRPKAQQTLKQCGETAVKPLATALTEPKASTRLYAAQTLGQLGWLAKSAVPTLVSASQDDADLRVRSHAVQALQAIAQDSQRQSNQVQGWQVKDIQKLKDLKQHLDTTLTTLTKDKTNWATKAKELAALQLARNGLQTQVSQLTDQPTYQVVSWTDKHPWIAGAAVLGLVLVSGYGGIFLFKPIWLLKLGDVQVKAIATIPKVGPLLSGVLQGLSPLKYHPRVLDAWITQQLATATANFTSPTNTTVSDRAIHVPLPVKLNSTPELEFGPPTLQSYFQRSRLCLLITGEGGAGKTSLACQIAHWGLDRKLAKHVILPILLEQELDESVSLVDVVQGYLQVLVATEDPLDKAFVAALLRKRRLLVIVDHLSELSEQTRTKIRPADREFPIHALIVTSRLPEERLRKDVQLEPMRVEGNRLSEFINTYLTAKEKRKLFEDEDYFEICRRLSRMVGQRNITVLLARLYTDQTIEQQEGAGGKLPDSIPELMLSYLNQLNRTIEPANQRDQLQVQQDAQAIAWQCLNHTYRPTAAKKADAIAGLVAQGAESEADAKSRLDYLEKRLRLLQTLEPGDKLRIILDPLAEYLAANYLVDFYCQQDDLESVWQQFLTAIDQYLERNNETPDTIQGFLLAVRDCCLVKQPETGIPDSVPAELARKAGLDPEELRLAQEKRRIRLLISELSAPELEYRIRAAEDLSQRGAAAKMAAPNLIGMLENRNQTLEARQAAAQALGKLGIGSESLLTLLTDPSEDPAVRRSVAESLGRMKAGQTELLSILEDNHQSLPVRQGAARALSLIGAPSGQPVPMLIVELKAAQVITQVKSIPVWQEPLTAELTLDLVDIPGGEFLMGSPPDQVGRDWYKHSYPELEGVDVEAQHRVTVQSFQISQFPITQAQWRCVAALPRMNRDLDPDPANFKGNDRPVEQVSWHDAIEFCDRLSQHTGKTYRLPSESEWEYACRAGTATPFHFGETLNPELANYDGNYTYGEGNTGEFRQKTTEVGSFGVVNAFGLSDMHGNVWEWCLDHWHPSYTDAPDDGSAWMTGGDVGEASLKETRYRLLRGGSWYNCPGNCRSANRYRYTPHDRDNVIGFRVLRVPPWTL